MKAHGKGRLQADDQHLRPGADDGTSPGSIRTVRLIQPPCITGDVGDGTHCSQAIQQLKVAPSCE